MYANHTFFFTFFAIYHLSLDGTPLAPYRVQSPNPHDDLYLFEEVAMPILTRLQSYLDANKIPYEVVSHPKVYTARDVAQTLDVPGKLVAKVVVVKADKYFVMTVLPSTWRIDLKRLQDVLEARDVRLATEAECANLFPDCQVGTMPPFGNLYGVEVYVDQLLTEDESIVFEAGTYVGAIKLRYKDFADLVRPKVAAFHHEPSKIED
jgi:Ala-tRNA(Pro) deacylase